MSSLLTPSRALKVRPSRQLFYSHRTHGFRNFGGVMTTYSSHAHRVSHPVNCDCFLCHCLRVQAAKYRRRTRLRS